MHYKYMRAEQRGFRLLAMVACLFGFAASYSQDITGYGYLDLPVSARGLALGGTSISVVEPELSLAEQNPSLLCPEMARQVAISYTRYMGDVNLGYAAYCGRFLEVGGWSVGMRFIDYGDFSGYDEQGISTGSFGVKDMSLQGAVGYPINDRLRVGAQAKFLYTTYESYSAFAMGVDLGLNYYNEATGNSLSLTATNLGGQFKPLYEERKEKLPTQLNLGWSSELQHLPLCVSVTAYHLLDWDHDYVDGSGTRHSFKDSEMVFNHLIFGVEWSGQGGFLRGVGLGAGVNYRQLAFMMAYASAHAGDGTMTFQFNYSF